MGFIELKPGHAVRLDCVAGVEVLHGPAYRKSGPQLNVLLTQGGETYCMSVDYRTEQEAQAAAEKLVLQLAAARDQSREAKHAERLDMFAAAALEGMLARDKWIPTALLSRVLEIANAVALALDTGKVLLDRDGHTGY